MSLPGPDPVDRWRRPSRTHGSPLPRCALLWALAVLAALLPTPWAPLIWWVLAAPFALMLRAVVNPALPPDRPLLRSVALGLGLIEVGALLLGFWLLAALLGGAGIPAALVLVLIGAIAGWTVLGRASAFRPLQALTAAIPERDAIAAWTRLRQTPGPALVDRALRLDHLVLSSWLLLPWLLTLPEVVRALPFAPLAYALLLFPALALWLVDLDPARLGVRADPEPFSDEPLPLSVHDAPTEAEPEVDPTLQLVAAVRRGDVASVHHWLEAGVSPDSTPPSGAPDPRSALQSAVASGHLDLLQMLLRAGADVHRLVHGRHALGEAARLGDHGHPEVLAALLAAGADPDRPEADGSRPLHHAARLADPAVALALLQAGATLDAISGEGMTPLGVALQAGNGALAAVLMDAGAELEPPGAVPALHAAVYTTEDTVDGLRLLQLRRANPSLRDGAGRTALMLAAAANHPAQLEALAAAGCPVDAVDAEGRNALMLAASAGAGRALHALLALRAPVAAVDAGGNSALHHAVAGGRADREAIELLLGAGVPTNLRNADGMSAEELAYAHARPGLARLLAPADATADEDALSVDVAPVSGGSAVLERGDRLVQACALHRFDVALSLIRQGGLPQSVWVEALLAAGDRLERVLLDALLAAGLRIDALAHPSPQLTLARRLPCPAGPLQVLLAAGASVEADDGGDTLLALICGRAEDLAGVGASASPPLSLLEAVLAGGPALTLRDRDGHLPLHYAIYHRPLSWVEALLAQGADPNAPDRGGRGALHHAVVAPRPDREALVRLLILAGGDPAQTAVDGSTAQGLAAMAGAPALAALCDFRPGEHPRHRLQPADVPRAARDGRGRLLYRLLDLGLPVDARDERQATALIHAAGLGHLEMVQALLARGAQLTLKSDRGVDALAAAVLGGRLEIVSLLLDRAAHVNTDYAGMTPVALAASRADPSMLQLLLQRGGRVDAQQMEQSPLALALRAALRLPDPAPAFACVDALLARRAPLELRDAAGRTLLLFLCGSGANAPVAPEGPVLLSLVGRLLAAGAAVNATDSYERNAAHWACRHHQPALLSLLLQHGVDTMKPDDMRKLPIDLVTARRRHEFLELLDGAAAPDEGQ